jgi:hypothetical protein
MDADVKSVAKELTPQETAAVLQQILDAVQKDEHKHWVEIACAVVLSLAMLASAWCAYQANLWSGVQDFRLAAANQAGRESSKASLEALQFRAVDAVMLIDYLQARTQSNQELEKILYDRFRPEMKQAVEAWLKTDPLNNPAAPSSPFKMAEYVQKELQEAKGHDEVSAREHTAAEEANEASDTYVLLTVAFTSVLFFGGIAGSFRSRRVRIAFFAIALFVFVATVGALGTMPICRE